MTQITVLGDSALTGWTNIICDGKCNHWLDYMSIQCDGK